MIMHKLGDLEAFTSQKGPFLIISFVGDFNEITVCEIETLSEQIQSGEFNFEFAVFNLRDLKTYDPIAGLVWANIQNRLREMGKPIKVCGLKPEIKDEMESGNVIKPEEVVGNLTEALHSFAEFQMMKRSA